MDDTMDYAYHHRSEQQPSHGQLPYPQPMSRCPYTQHRQPAMVPHRSTVPYDPVHSANNWQAQPSPMPAHWNPHMAGHRGPYMRLPNSAPEPSYYGHPPLPNYPPGMPGYQLPSYEPTGLHSSHSAYPAPMPPLPPPMRYGNAGPMQSHPPLPNPGGYTTSERLSNHALPPRFGYEVSSVAAPTAAETSTTSTAPAQNPSTPGEETPSVTEPNTAEPPASVNIQFGSAPPSGAPQSNNPAVTLSAYRSQRPSAAEQPPPIAHSQRAAIDERSRLPADSASTTSVNSAGTSGTATHSYERRRAPQTARRTYPRRQSPPSDREYDNENEMRMLEHMIVQGGARLLGPDLEDHHVRATQFLRGSVSTKMVASEDAILSLQSVPISELPEGETTCVICYNEYGVETPEGVKEAPLRLPKCKHTFGDHCIKKWLADSDSCPYCRDRIPSHPRLSSNVPGFNGLFRTRALLRERGESAYGHDESNRSTSGLSGHVERRSPPTDIGESRRRIRARYGSSRGPGSPSFSGSRPVSFGPMPPANHESLRRSQHNFGRGTAPHHSAARPLNGGPPHAMFPMGNMPLYHQVPSLGGMENPLVPSMPAYVPPMVAHGTPSGSQNAGTHHTARSSLPAPPPETWQPGGPSLMDETHRRPMLGDNNPATQTGAPRTHQ